MFKYKSIIAKLFLAITVSLYSCNYNEKSLTEQADEIHESILTLDSHVDTPLMYSREGFDMAKHNEIGKLDFPRMNQGGLDAVFFAVFLGQGSGTPEAYETAKRRAFNVFNQTLESLKKNSDIAGLATTSDDAYRLKKEGKKAVYIGVENGYPIGYDLEILHEFYSLGARYLGIVHSANNHLADSSSDPEGEEHGGLSEFGKEIIPELNRMGMMVDVSHISDKAFYDVVKISKAPIIASHSNARSICNHNRNLDDNMLKALADNGGVIQLCLLSAYVKETERNPQRDSAIAVLRKTYNNYRDLSDEELDTVRRKWSEINKKYPAELATVSDLVDHVDYVAELIGIDHIGIGSDFDGGGGLEDCKDVSEMKNITVELLRRGYSKKDIEKIWGGNFMRVFKEVEKYAEKFNS
ncbi:MAG: dipeptidase [Bacteroidales bacterium]